jgi:hypothetical protein
LHARMTLSMMGVAGFCKNQYQFYFSHVPESANETPWYMPGTRIPTHPFASPAELSARAIGI